MFLSPLTRFQCLWLLIFLQLFPVLSRLIFAGSEPDGLQLTTRVPVSLRAGDDSSLVTRASQVHEDGAKDFFKTHLHGLIRPV